MLYLNLESSRLKMLVFKSLFWRIYDTNRQPRFLATNKELMGRDIGGDQLQRFSARHKYCGNRIVRAYP